MIGWIESQSVAAIAFLVFGFCYALAAVVLAAGMAVAARPIAASLKATTPTMLTPVSLIAGLLMAFLAQGNRVKKPTVRSALRGNRHPIRRFYA
jgi:tellurite resistance protein TehA-like permease